jgi:hypothetical protein
MDDILYDKFGNYNCPKHKTFQRIRLPVSHSNYLLPCALSILLAPHADGDRLPLRLPHAGERPSLADSPFTQPCSLPRGAAPP